MLTSQTPGQQKEGTHFNEAVLPRLPFDRDPNLHATQSRSRVEFFCITLEEARRFRTARDVFIARPRKPFLDSFARISEVRDMFPVRKNGVSLRRNAYNAEFAGKARGIGNLD